MAVRRNRRLRARQAIETALVALIGLVMAGSIAGCLMVGGSSRGGFFLWPGSIGGLILVFIVVMLLRRR